MEICLLRAVDHVCGPSLTDSPPPPSVGVHSGLLEMPKPLHSTILRAHLYHLATSKDSFIILCHNGPVDNYSDKEKNLQIILSIT